jgi:ABC-type uncharacterized transport system permease subunit
VSVGVLRSVVDAAGRAGLAVVIGVGVVAAVLAALGDAPGPALAALVSGSMGSTAAWTATVLKAAPLLLSGLAVALAFRCGVWNIGAEGQLLFGALCATAVATRIGSGVPAIVLLPLLMLAAALGGALLGAIAGVLRARRGVSEVISTILLNFVAIQLVALAVQGPLQESVGAYPKSDPFPAAAMLPAWGRLHLGLLLALVIAVAVYAVVFRSAFGFRLRAVGLSARAARFAGISPERTALAVLALSGGLAGVAGGVEVSGVTGQLFQGLSAGTGYTAIAVALLARLHPIGVIPAALFFGALEAGAGAMQRSAGVPAVATQVIQAVVILVSVGFAFARDSESAVDPDRVAEASS